MSSASVESVVQCADDLKNINVRLSDTIADVTNVNTKVQQFVDLEAAMRDRLSGYQHQLSEEIVPTIDFETLEGLAGHVVADNATVAEVFDCAGELKTLLTDVKREADVRGVEVRSEAIASQYGAVRSMMTEELGRRHDSEVELISTWLQDSEQVVRVATPTFLDTRVIESIVGNVEAVATSVEGRRAQIRDMLSKLKSDSCMDLDVEKRSGNYAKFLGRLDALEADIHTKKVYILY